MAGCEAPAQLGPIEILATSHGPLATSSQVP